MIQVISLLGSIVILGAYVAGQRGFIEPRQRLYALLNFVGSAVLTSVAIVEEQWGFLVLEAAWALVSAYSLVRPPPDRPALATTDRAITDA